MFTILTHQSIQYQGRDVLIINGEKSFLSGNQEHKDAQSRINGALKSQYKKRIPAFCQAAGASPSLKCYVTDSRELVLSSNYLSKDENGRNITFDFYCDSFDDPDTVVRFLSDDSLIAGMNLNPADIKTIKNFLSFYRKRARNYALMGVVAVAVLLVLIKIIF